jgi:transcriptional regulator with PAS, ATPase and Fis domain
MANKRSDVLDNMKKEALIAALKSSNGNRTKASKSLNISVRTIRNWIKRFALEKRFPSSSRQK